ncbi:MAG: GGDEF domain-containing protein [Eubacteriales bacterium]|nr:GGDEF domain-containing protein [Eubacteriales bacterium]
MLYFIFAVPVLLTVIYSDYILTTITSAAGIAAKTLSELFIVWDPNKYRPLDSVLNTFNFIISTCILVAFLITCLIVIRFEREKNTASIQKEIERFKMRRKLLTDELTQVYNRTALRSAFQDMENDKSSSSYVFVMMDMDNFKSLNDTLGHHKGDDSLKIFGSILKKHCGDAVPIRFGGDEFCVLFKNKSIQQVRESCGNIQNELRDCCATQSGEPLTVSVGIARYDKGMTAAQLLKNSDIALYKAKEHRDTICVYEQN